MCYLMDTLDKTEEYFQAGIVQNKSVRKKETTLFQGKTFDYNCKESILFLSLVFSLVTLKFNEWNFASALHHITHNATL